MTFANSAFGASPDDRTIHLKDTGSKMDRLQKHISSEQEKISGTVQVESNLLTELDNLETTITNDEEKLRHYQQEITSRQQSLATLQQELAVIMEEKNLAQIHLKKRLAAYYRMGPVTTLNVIFSATSLPALLKLENTFGQLLQYDQGLIDGYRQKISVISSKQTALQHEQQELEANIAELNARKQDLNTVKKEKADLLTRVSSEKRLYLRALEEMENAKTKLTSTIAALDKQTRDQAQKQLHVREQQQQINGLNTDGQSANQIPNLVPRKIIQYPASTVDFAAWKGMLQAPVSGTVTAFFGKTDNGKFGMTAFQNGIDIKNDTEVEVQAIFDGIVQYAGNLRGYGQMIIVDHGNGYLSVLSRMTELYKKKGEKVKRGEMIGIIRDARGLIGDGLHFEIRRGTDPLNPLQWVDTSNLILQAIGQ